MERERFDSVISVVWCVLVEAQSVEIEKSIISFGNLPSRNESEENLLALAKARQADQPAVSANACTFTLIPQILTKGVNFDAYLQ